MRYAADSLTDLVFAAAQSHGQRPALWVRDEVVTYRELASAADQVAAKLIASGVAPGDRVGILTSRSKWAYVAILGALRAGCVYVPLNLRFPAARNLDMLEQAGVTAIIADRYGLSALPPERLAPLMALRVLIAPDLDDGAAGDLNFTIAGRSELAAAALPVSWPKTTRDHLCYLLFTSGSTGKPKGVPISHGNVLDYLDGVSALGEVSPQDRVVQLVDLTFDLSAHDIFLAWTNGAALYSIPENNSIFASRFVEEHELTCWLSVPSTAGLMKQRGLIDDNVMPSLRLSYFCGEALPTETARAWARAAPNSRVINLYGPTEATIAFSYFAVDPVAADLPAIVPLGRPLGSQEMALLDAQGQPVNDGETAELHLSGSQLTRGYWQAPHIDVEKFVVASGRRWYRTGDLARFDPRYGYLFAGRVDHQVKIGGFRVELQEIETVVRAGSGRDVVAVVPWPLGEDGGALGTVAFIAGDVQDSETILAGCRAKLPDYMVPGRILFIPEMPVNANGKVDYLQLKDHPGLRSP